MRPFRLLASDIDGTLLDKNRELSAATIAQLTRLKEDVPIVLISFANASGNAPFTGRIGYFGATIGVL